MDSESDFSDFSDTDSDSEVEEFDFQRKPPKKQISTEHVIVDPSTVLKNQYSVTLYNILEESKREWLQKTVVAETHMQNMLDFVKNSFFTLQYAKRNLDFQMQKFIEENPDIQTEENIEYSIECLEKKLELLATTNMQQDMEMQKYKRRVKEIESLLIDCLIREEVTVTKLRDHIVKLRKREKERKELIDDGLFKKIDDYSSIDHFKQDYYKVIRFLYSRSPRGKTKVDPIEAYLEYDDVKEEHVRYIEKILNHIAETTKFNFELKEMKKLHDLKNQFEEERKKLRIHHQQEVDNVTKIVEYSEKKTREKGLKKLQKKIDEAERDREFEEEKNDIQAIKEILISGKKKKNWKFMKGNNVKDSIDFHKAKTYVNGLLDEYLAKNDPQAEEMLRDIFKNIKDVLFREGYKEKQMRVVKNKLDALKKSMHELKTRMKLKLSTTNFFLNRECNKFLGKTKTNNFEKEKINPFENLINSQKEEIEKYREENQNLNNEMKELFKSQKKEQKKKKKLQEEFESLKGELENAKKLHKEEIGKYIKDIQVIRNEKREEKIKQQEEVLKLLSYIEKQNTQVKNSSQTENEQVLIEKYLNELSVLKRQKQKLEQIIKLKNKEEKIRSRTGDENKTSIEDERNFLEKLNEKLSKDQNESNKNNEEVKVENDVIKKKVIEGDERVTENEKEKKSDNKKQKVDKKQGKKEKTGDKNKSQKKKEKKKSDKKKEKKKKRERNEVPKVSKIIKPPSKEIEDEAIKKLKKEDKHLDEISENLNDLLAYSRSRLGKSITEEEKKEIEKEKDMELRNNSKKEMEKENEKKKGTLKKRESKKRFSSLVREKSERVKALEKQLEKLQKTLDVFKVERSSIIETKDQEIFNLTKKYEKILENLEKKAKEQEKKAKALSISETIFRTYYTKYKNECKELRTEGNEIKDLLKKELEKLSMFILEELPTFIKEMTDYNAQRILFGKKGKNKKRRKKEENLNIKIKELIKKRTKRENEINLHSQNSTGNLGIGDDILDLNKRIERLEKERKKLTDEDLKIVESMIKNIKNFALERKKELENDMKNVKLQEKISHVRRIKEEIMKKIRVKEKKGLDISPKEIEEVRELTDLEKQLENLRVDHKNTKKNMKFEINQIKKIVSVKKEQLEKEKQKLKKIKKHKISNQEKRLNSINLEIEKVKKQQEVLEQKKREKMENLRKMKELKLKEFEELKKKNEERLRELHEQEAKFLEEQKNLEENVKEKIEKEMELLQEKKNKLLKELNTLKKNKKKTISNLKKKKREIEERKKQIINEQNKLNRMIRVRNRRPPPINEEEKNRFQKIQEEINRKMEETIKSEKQIDDEIKKVNESEDAEIENIEKELNQLIKEENIFKEMNEDDENESDVEKAEKIKKIILDRQRRELEKHENNMKKNESRIRNELDQLEKKENEQSNNREVIDPEVLNMIEKELGQKFRAENNNNNKKDEEENRDKKEGNSSDRKRKNVDSSLILEIGENYENQNNLSRRSGRKKDKNKSGKKYKKREPLLPWNNEGDFSSVKEQLLKRDNFKKSQLLQEERKKKIFIHGKTQIDGSELNDYDDNTERIFEMKPFHTLRDIHYTKENENESEIRAPSPSFKKNVNVNLNLSGFGISVVDNNNKEKTQNKVKFLTNNGLPKIMDYDRRHSMRLSADDGKTITVFNQRSEPPSPHDYTVFHPPVHQIMPVTTTTSFTEFNSPHSLVRYGKKNKKDNKMKQNFDPYNIMEEKKKKKKKKKKKRKKRRAWI